MTSAARQQASTDDGDRRRASGIGTRRRSTIRVRLTLFYGAVFTLCGLALLLVGYLMVSTIKYPEFKGHGEKIKPVPVVVTLVIVGALLFLRPDSWLFAPFFAFTLFGLVNSLFSAIN